MKRSGQYGQNFNYVIRKIFRLLTPVIMHVKNALFKTIAATFYKGSYINDSFKSALKITLRTASKHGGKALGNLIKKQ